MKTDLYEEIAASLCAVPDGTVVIEPQTEPFFLQPHADTDGKGKMTFFLPFEGVAISYHEYLASRFHFCHASSARVLEINCCCAGRMGWTLSDKYNLYMGEGDLSIQSTDHCANSDMTLPLGCYRGITVFLDFAVLRPESLPVLENAQGLLNCLQKKYLNKKMPLQLPACEQTQHLFAGLQSLAPQARLTVLRLRLLELLVFLGKGTPDFACSVDRYHSQTTELVRGVHDLLTQDLSRRYTIGELAKVSTLNTTTLKTVFKSVYGTPIAAYMKAIRMRRASELLRTTSDSVSAVAQAVGYDSQSRFTSAFKAEYGLLPTEYRKYYAKRYTAPHKK